jgi:aldose 1-epimerase
LFGAVALGVAMMLLTWIFEAALFTAVPALASPGAVNGGGGVPAPGPDGKYVLQSEGIRATFIPYGASISNLFIKDKAGVERDIVLGFDNATYYSEDESHPHLGGVPGRYANRIKNRYVPLQHDP